MKREDLKAMGLTDEQIDKIMAENGKDVEAQKAKTTAAETSLKTATDQLTEAGKQIEAFKGMNIDQIKASADDYKAKFEQAQADAAAQMSALKFDHALEGALTGAKAKNAKAVKALLDMPNLKMNEADGSIIGLEEQLKKIKESADYLFESDGPAPRIVAGGNNQPISADAITAAARTAAGLK